MTTLKIRKKDPDVVAFDFSDPLVPDLKLGYDENHDIVIIDNGMKDLQARIDAAGANVPTLAELCENMPGNTPLQKLQSAIDGGVLPKVDGSGDVVDYTDVPETIGDFARTGQEAKKVLGSSKDIASLVDELIASRLEEIKKAEAGKAQAKEGVNE